MLEYGARNYDPTIGRYFNIDNYNELYHDMNPYQYTSNNPVKFIDVNGDYIYVYGAGGQGYRYSNGQLQEEKDGEWVEYNAKAGSYESKILSNLNKITEGDPNSVGSQFLGLFENDKINVDVRNNPVKKGKNKDKNATDGTTVYTSFNQKGDLRTTSGSEKLTENFHITLGHELAHGLANNIFNQDVLKDVWVKDIETAKGPQSISNSEVYASMWENMIRGSQGLPLRTHYIGGTSDDRSRLIQKSKTSSREIPTYNPTIKTMNILKEILKSKKQ